MSQKAVDIFKEAEELIKGNLPELAENEVNPDVVEQYFDTLDNNNLMEQVQGALNEYDAMIRKMVLEDGRIDVLCEEVLGYTLQPFHLKILITQERVGPDEGCLILCFRGSGKSTIGTVARAVFEIIRNPNIRILIASNTQIQAEVFLREIKEHFEANDKLIRIFGHFKGHKWDTKEIIVAPRTINKKEATLTCIGVGGPTASRHYDLILGDDLVDEENARTDMQRERLRIWYYKSLAPTLEAGGRIFNSGTRWHPADLYSYIITNTEKLQTCIVKGIQDDGTSPWPDRYPIDWMLSKRRELGGPIFETQYQMNTSSMEGRIFTYDNFHWYDQLPDADELIYFQAVDLAISKKDESDFFAHCTLAWHPQTNKRYVVAFWKAKLTFAQQTNSIKQEFYKYGALKVGIESNAYQAAQAEAVSMELGKKKVKPLFTTKDKFTRAIKLAAKVECGDILFRKDQHELVELLIKMPDVDHDDLFDALDFAVETSYSGLRKQRDAEPGML